MTQESIPDEDRLNSNTLGDAGRDIQAWFSSELGQSLLKQENSRASKVLARLFGYHLLQIGSLGAMNFLSGSSITHKILMQFESETGSERRCDLLGDESSLAIASDSMDVVVLPHVLEYSSNPHRLLREVERVLIGEGHLLITGFNPLSFWGLWRLMLFWREKTPWNGHFYRAARLKDWLSLLDFEILESECFFFRPPLRRRAWMQKLLFCETLGKHCWPFFGGAYIILAKKRVIPLTPVKMRWHARRKLIASGIMEPGTPG